MNNDSFFANNSDKLNITPEMMFDRVVNLKFITGATENGVDVVKDTYVIRSDFEVVYPNLTMNVIMKQGALSKKNYYFRKCRHKPSIKVQYKQVSGGTNIELDIFVSNFMLMDKDGNCMQTFNFAENRLLQVEVMLGYFGQFQKTFNVDTATMDDYMTLKTSVDLDKIVMRNVAYASYDKLPPDSVLHIHGFVGNIENSPLDASNEVSTFSAVTDEEYEMDLSNKSYSEIFDTLITRRFLKNSAVDKLSKDPETAKSIVTGKLMDKETAKKYGIKVKLATSLKNRKVEAKLNASGEATSNKVVIKKGDTSEKTLNSICSALGSDITYRSMNNGDFFVYTNNKETEVKAIHDDLTDYFTNNAFGKRNGVLPAVTNINISVISTITCPYFGFLEPFQDFFFKTRYALTTLVTYFANIDIKSYDFYAIGASISFATVEDINEMTIRAVVRS